VVSTNYPYDFLKLHFHKGFYRRATVFWINHEGPSVGFALWPYFYTLQVGNMFGAAPTKPHAARLTIGVESAEDAGSAFWIELPAAESLPARGGERASPPA